MHSIQMRPATASDAGTIGRMSRDLIEHGLPWTWTPARIARCVRDPETVVLAARRQQLLVGFAIMTFGESESHLSLLAVRPAWQRQGIGRRLLGWLETSARVAGAGVVYLEVRADNPQGRAFYRSLGYQPVQRVSGYYNRSLAALRMARDLDATRLDAPLWRVDHALRALMSTDRDDPLRHT